MLNIVKAAALVMVGGTLVSGCAMSAGGNAMATGFVYSGYKTPGNIGPGQGTKTGEACISSVLGIVATGDSSVAAAKKAGGITQVSHVDHEVFGVLGIYATSCTIVTGQ